MKIPLILLILTILMVGTAGASTINVTDVGGLNNYTTIQEAVNAANADSSIERILVYPGTYNETVDVNIPLNITSKGGATVTHVKALDSGDHVFDITANGVTINGFNVSGATEDYKASIYLYDANYCNITNNNISNSNNGIFLYSSSSTLKYNNLVNNHVSGNDGNGIYLSTVADSNLTNNVLSQNNNGIYLYSSQDNELIDNTVLDNHGKGIYLELSQNNNLAQNNVSGNNDGIYMHSPEDASSDNNFTSNTVVNNSNGIFLQYPQDSTLTDNIVYNNSNGIFLQYPLDSTLTDNTVSNNSESGITLDDVDKVHNENNILIDNTVLNNNKGIDILYVNNNTLIGNTVLDNNNGICIDNSYYNNLTQNNVSNNIDNGVHFVSSHENRLVNNTILNNNIGLFLGGQYGSSNNFIGNNYFNNSNNADSHAGSDNHWNTTNTTGPNIIGGPYIGGNFWAAPDGNGFSQVNTDTDGDGFCDTPNDNYKISEEQYDYLPLASTVTDDKPPVVVPNTPLEEKVGPGDLLELNVSVTDESDISSVVVDVSSINDTVNEAVLNNVSGYWVNNSIIVDTNTDGMYNLSINATDVYGNSNTSMNLSVVRDSFVTVGQNKDYTTIQDAIDNTYDGDTIQVFSGDYEENLILDKGLTIQAASDDPSKTVIEYNGSFLFNEINPNLGPDSVIELHPEEITQMNVTICGFTIDGNDAAYQGVGTYSDLPLNDITLTDNVIKNIRGEGIFVHGTNAVDLVNNTIVNTSSGIVVNPEMTRISRDTISEVNMETGPSINVIGNNMTNIGEFGIQIGSPSVPVGTPGYMPYSYIRIEDNTIKGDFAGIFVSDSDKVDITDNRIDCNNGYFSRSLEYEVSVYGPFGIYTESIEYVDIQNNSIDEAYGGINVENSFRTNITDNEITNAYNGIANELEAYQENQLGTPVYRQSVIEDNYVTLKPDTLPKFTSSFLIPMDRFGIGVSNTNSSIKGNTVIGTGADVRGPVFGIVSFNGYFVQLKDFPNISTNIENNRIENTGVGLYTFSPDTRVVDNHVNMTRMGMLSFETINKGAIIGNTFDNTNMGIMALSMRDTIIQDNVINNGTWTNSSVGIAIETGLNNTIVDNSVSISPNNTIFGDRAKSTSNLDDGKSIGILLSLNSDSHIENNHVEEAGIGIEISNPRSFNPDTVDSFVMNSSSSQITSMSENFAINFKPSEPIYVNLNNTVTGNTVKDSDMCGLYLSNSNNTTIYNNYFNNYNNTMLDNLSINNTSWNINKTSGNNIVGGEYLGGNFWVHPNGTGFSVDTADSNNDGICDLPYNLTENETDALPLAPAPKAAPEKDSSSGGRAYVGPSMPPEDVKGSDSAIKRILADSNVKYDFPDGEGPVLGISFDAKDDKGTVVAKVQVLKDKPDDVDEPKGNSYQLMSITVGNEGTISDDNSDNILIEFKVSKEWIEENNIDPSTIRMTRFNNGDWQDLPSNEVGEDDEYFYFTAETPGFSVFSIVGDEYKEVTEEPLAEEPEVEDVEEPASETEEESAQTPGFTSLLAIALIAGAALIMRKD